MNDIVIDQAKQLLSQDKKIEAGRLLATLLQSKPTDAEVWYLFSACVEEPVQKIDCLQRALRYQTEYAEAQRALDLLLAPQQISVPTVIENQPTTVVAVPVEEITINPADVVQIKPVMPTDRTTPKTNSKPAGDSTSKIAQYYIGMNKLDRVFFYIFVFFLFLSSLIIFFEHRTIWSYIAYFLLLIFATEQVVKVSKFKKESDLKKNTYTKGAIGEIEIGQILASLGPNYCVWHDVTCNHGNIDHLVLSKNGHLFMIETKSHFGTLSINNSAILINGKTIEKNFIKQCTNNLFDLRKTIMDETGKEVWVSSILVFTNAFVPFMAPIKNIHIVNKKFLRKTILEIDQHGRGELSLWDQVPLLDDLFCSCENQAAELHRAHYARLSGWGKEDFEKRRKQKGV